MKNVTLRQLEIFREVAREKKLSRAADKLFLTPPAVTIQLKELERRLDLPLFYRRGRKLVITTEGEQLLRQVQKIQAAINDAYMLVRQLKNIDLARITIGMVSPAKYFLPSLLSLFRRQFPGVEVKLIEGNRERLLNLLRDSDVDFAVMGRTSQTLDTVKYPFARQPHVFCSSPRHPLARRKRLTPENLRDYPFLMREAGSGTRTHLEKILVKASVELKVVLESSSNETIKQSIIADMGISFLSMHTLGQELENKLIHLLPVVGTPVTSTWYVVAMASKTASPAAQALQEFIVNQGGDFLNSRFGQYV